MLLHYVIKSKHLDMTSLEKLTQQELRSIAKNVELKSLKSFKGDYLKNFASGIHFLHGVLKKMWDVNSVKFYYFFLIVITEKSGL